MTDAQVELDELKAIAVVNNDTLVKKQTKITKLKTKLADADKKLQDKEAELLHKTRCLKSALVLMTTNWRGAMQVASLTQLLILLEDTSFRVKRSQLLGSSRDRTHFLEPCSRSVLGNGLWKLWKLPERARLSHAS